jgi:hypothetical protein
MNRAARIPLTQLPSVLRERRYTQKPVKYKRVYDAAVSQAIPARKDNESGRWDVGEDDLPEIAKILCHETEA